MLKKLKLFFKYIALVVVVITVVIIGCDFWVKKVASSRDYSDVSFIPTNKVGVVLGTSKFLSTGHKNLFFSYRIDAAVKLFSSGKIKYVLVSGDNRNKSYNEPRDMFNALVSKGIPASRIVLDFAGFRTWDSVLRAHKVFGQNSFTIISQKFHNERAIFIGQKNGLDVVGFDAKNVSIRYGKKTFVREYLARVKVVIDYVIGKDPKFYGDPVRIGS